MFKCFVVGNIGSDATVRPMDDGCYVNFSVAHNYREYDKKGNMVDRTQWVNCAYFQKEDKISQWLVKGKQVAVMGTAKAYAFSSPGGEIIAGLSMKVNELQLLGSSNNQEKTTHNENKTNDHEFQTFGNPEINA